jgi:hypothetical protein
MKDKICVINYAYQNITSNTFKFWKIMLTFSVKLIQKTTDDREDEIILVEENKDHYDCECDVSELYMPAT